jgi:hypothetical protein
MLVSKDRLGKEAPHCERNEDSETQLILSLFSSGKRNNKINRKLYIFTFRLEMQYSHNFY